MSAILRKDLETLPTEMYRPTHDCFYCGEVLTGDRWVMWNGNDEINQQIWFHPRCAIAIAFHLTKDGKT